VTAKPEILFAWLGATDLKASRNELGGLLGPIAQALETRAIGVAHIFCNYPKPQGQAYLRWLQKRSRAKVIVHQTPLSRPTMLGEIYEGVSAVLGKVVREARIPPRLIFHLSPGTPQMAIVWMMLANSQFPAQLIESSAEHGVNVVTCPFEIDVHYLPDISERTANDVLTIAQGLPPAAPEFEAIIHRCQAMQELVVRARRAAILDFPALLEGESGTGKELLARAIHRSSRRATGPFIGVNCGAIPSELVESEFFGHEKGAFTGAAQVRTGHLVAADGGTLFLDEIGELPLPAQVKLLRAVQERSIQPVGSSRARSIDFRIIAATNRDLRAQVRQGAFREDLYHRLAVAVLRIPPLRQRSEDFPALIDHSLGMINQQCASLPGWKNKKISKEAINFLMGHAWPGNIRELLNTLTRCAIWSPAAMINETDVQAALSPSGPEGSPGDFALPTHAGNVDLPGLVAALAQRHLRRALQESAGNKARAAKALGLPSYQTFINWCRRYGVDLPEPLSDQRSRRSSG